MRIPRRTFLGAAGLTTAALLGGRAVLASRGPTLAPSVGAADQVAPAPVDDLAAALDYDLDRIFRYVADDIAYEPYAGSLRGPTATLAGRAGNSADKALLLAALLDAAIVPWRLVTGALDDAAAEDLQTSWQADLATIDDRATRVLLQSPPLADGLTPAPTTPPAPLGPDAQAILDRALADADRVTQLTTTMLEDGVRTITDALAASGIAIPTAADEVPELERTQHVWLQAQQGVDWVDMDPTLAGTQPGATIATPVATELSALPDALRHRVEVRVLVERIAGTGVEQDTILEVIAFADELGGVPMVLLHETPDGLAGLGVSIGGTLAGTSQYQPILQVDETAHVGQVGLAFANGDGGVLGGLGSGARDGEATAEWLETTTVAPDGTTTVARRTLFDRIGPEARASGTIDVTNLPAPELVQLEPGGPSEVPAMRTLHFLAVATGSTSPAVFSDIDASDESAWPLHVTGHLYHLARDAANATIAAPQGARLIHDAPNVVRFSVEPVIGSTGDFTTNLDILHRSFRALPVVGQETASAPGILAGVLSEAVERIAMGAAAASSAVAPVPVVSVGAVMEQAAAQGIETIVVRPGDALASLGYPVAAMQVLGSALDAGLVAIGPARPVTVAGEDRLGWWLFDPVTGRVTDQLDDGRGVAMLEYLGNVLKSFLARHPYIKLGLCIALILKTLASMFQGMSGGSPLLFAVGLAGALSPINAIACG